MSPFAWLECRVSGLGDDVTQVAALGGAKQKAAGRVGDAGTLLERARGGCAAGKSARGRKALGGAARQLARFQSLLRSRKARSVPPELRNTLIAEAGLIRNDVLALRARLHCP